MTERKAKAGTFRGATSRSQALHCVPRCYFAFPDTTLRSEALLCVALLVPDPGGADDVVDLGILRVPAKFGDGFFTGGDEECGVAGAAGADLDRDGVAGDAADGVDDLLDGESSAVAEVINEPALGCGFRFEGIEGQDVRGGQVADVDVVADAGAVWGGVIVAEDFDGLAAAEGDVEDERDEMRLGLVGFAAGDDARAVLRFRSAGDIEIAQRGGAKAVSAVEPTEHLLDQELGFAIGVGGAEGGAFRDGNGFRLAVYGGCRAENKTLRSATENGFEQGERGGGVIAEVGFRGFHRFAGFNEGGEVEDAVVRCPIGGCGAEKAFDDRLLGYVGLNEIDAGGYFLETGVTKVINDSNHVSLSAKERCNGASDVSGTAGNQNLHKKYALFPEIWYKFNLLHRLNRKSKCFRLFKDRL
jgi:hypothetical protein